MMINAAQKYDTISDADGIEPFVLLFAHSLVTSAIKAQRQVAKHESIRDDEDRKFAEHPRRRRAL
jgi:hypothetical protein